MGTDAHIFKVIDEVDPWKTIEDVKIAGENAGQIVRMSKQIYYNDDGSFNHTTANSANTYEDVDGAEQILMYIFGIDKIRPDDYFDFLVKNGRLCRVIIVDVFRDSEKIMLDFVYEYLKLNPDDIFWVEQEWFYTLADLEKIRTLPFDRDWCYKKPEWK